MKPEHVAIIPDGNRRWAKQQGKRAFFGHSQGMAAFEKIAIYAFDQEVKHLSIWGMSVDNIKRRSRTEVAGLMRIFSKQFTILARSGDIHKRRVRVRVIGQWRQYFPRLVQRAIDTAIEATSSYSDATLNFLLAYNGTDEMMRAFQLIADQARRRPVKVSAALIKSYLGTKELPPVDLLIRTGGEPHNSNGFMMWDTADAELYFSAKLWPAIGIEDMQRALADYARRRRRRGK